MFELICNTYLSQSKLWNIFGPESLPVQLFKSFLGDSPDTSLECTYPSSPVDNECRPVHDLSAGQSRSSPRSPRLTHLDAPLRFFHFANAPVDPWKIIQNIIKSEIKQITKIFSLETKKKT